MLMRPSRHAYTRSLALLSAVAAVAFPAYSAQAASGTWTNTASGLWSLSTNWSGSTIANGANFTADFSTLNITSTLTVHLDSARTIGALKFGDTTPSSNTVLDNNGSAANALTLSNVGTPGIDVANQTATLTVQ